MRNWNTAADWLRPALTTTDANTRRNRLLEACSSISAVTCEGELERVQLRH